MGVGAPEKLAHQLEVDWLEPLTGHIGRGPRRECGPADGYRPCGLRHADNVAAIAPESEIHRLL